MNATADARRDMWQTMVKPLFNAALVLLDYEPSLVHRTNLKRLWRGTFKQFMMISKKTSDDLVDEMINSDLEETAQTLVEECKKQWGQRKINESVDPKKRQKKQLNLLRGVPNTWCKLLKMQFIPCPKCRTTGVVCSKWHLRDVHGVDVEHVFDIWKKEICAITNQKKRIARKTITRKLRPIIEKHLRALEAVNRKLSSGEN
jgi:hypothetical protein